MLAVDSRPLQQVAGTFETTIWFGGRKRTDRIHIVGGQVYDDLIGNNFLKPLGVNIHCETMTISATRVTSEGLEKDFPDLFKDSLITWSWIQKPVPEPWDSDLTHSLRTLTRKETTFSWGPTEDLAAQKAPDLRFWFGDISDDRCLGCRTRCSPFPSPDTRRSGEAYRVFQQDVGRRGEKLRCQGEGSTCEA